MVNEDANRTCQVAEFGRQGTFNVFAFALGNARLCRGTHWGEQDKNGTQ